MLAKIHQLQPERPEPPSQEFQLPGSSDSPRSLYSPSNRSVLKTLLASPESARAAQLTRGLYRVEADLVNYQGGEHYEEGREDRVLVDGEYKRVTYEKISVVPTGEGRARVVVIVAVHDNPIWLAPLLWGAVVGVGAVGGYFLVDKVQEFTESPTGIIITVAASVLTIALAWKALT